MKELIERHVVSPVGIASKELVLAEHGAATAVRRIAQEDACETSRELVGDLR